MTPLEHAAVALAPFAEFIEWAEQNSHRLDDLDLLVRRNGNVLGHAGFTVADLYAAREAKVLIDAALEEG